MTAVVLSVPKTVGSAKTIVFSEQIEYRRPTYLSRCLRMPRGSLSHCSFQRTATVQAHPRKTDAVHGSAEISSQFYSWQTKAGNL